LQGNHAILAIPYKGEFYWIDCTSQIHPFGFVGDFTDDRLALVVTPEGGKIMNTVSYLNEQNYQKTNAEYHISKMGAISGNITITTAGVQYDNRFSLEKKTKEESIPVDKTIENEFGLYRVSYTYDETQKNVSYNYVQSSGFQIITSVHERIKIYNKDGFEYATVKERLYQSNDGNENLSGLKAYTYNLENGAIVKTKLKNSDTFSNELSKYYKEKKFTMPNLKEGSVIEYTYKLISPFSYTIDEIVLQYDIPIEKQEIRIGIPEYYSFKKNMKGYLTLNPVQNSTSQKINFTNREERSLSDGVTQSSYRTSSVDYRVVIDEYNMVNVPALKEEPYVNNMNNYRSSINYEIQYVQFPNAV